MMEWVPGSPVLMRRNELARHKGSKVSIEVLEGCLWLTRDGCMRDWILNKGDRASIDAGEQGILMALSETKLAFWRSGS